jgi:hypothetical protein
VDSQTCQVEPCARGERGAEELLDRAVVETLRHAGSARTLPRGRMPDGVDVAAVYRY